MRHLRYLAAAAAPWLAGSSAVLAHGGHAVPAGVPALDHLHLAGGLMVPGFSLAALVCIGVGLVVTGFRRRRSAASRNGTAGGSNRHHR